MIKNKMNGFHHRNKFLSCCCLYQQHKVKPLQRADSHQMLLLLLVCVFPGLLFVNISFDFDVKVSI